MIKKILKYLLIITVVAFAIGLYFYFRFKPASKVNFDLTFSHTYAASLGFDANQMYLDILSDLKPKKIRLMAYWDEIEPNQNQFDYKNVDFMITEAAKNNVEIILSLGKKLPRWPECHIPDWAGKLDGGKQKDALDNMLTTAVNHFKQYTNIKVWQIENEPFFGFGINCPVQKSSDVAAEVSLVKKLDSRPVMLTGSGEQGNWDALPKAGADIVGVTMYRTVYSDHFGYYKYPIGPWFYRLKAGYEQATSGKPVVGIELQAEPWLLSGIFHTDVSKQLELMNPNVFKQNVEFAKKTGFEDNYLWGVEWWYWLAKKQNNWGMWGAAKDLLATQK